MSFLAKYLPYPPSNAREARAMSAKSFRGRVSSPLPTVRLPRNPRFSRSSYAGTLSCRGFPGGADFLLRPHAILFYLPLGAPSVALIAGWILDVPSWPLNSRLFGPRSRRSGESLSDRVSSAKSVSNVWITPGGLDGEFCVFLEEAAVNARRRDSDPHTPAREIREE